MGFSTLFVLALVPITVLTDEVKCSFSIDISGGVQQGTSIIYNGITYEESNYFISGSEIRGCICNIKTCVRKCCREGEVLNVTSRSCQSLTNGVLSVETYHIINVPDNEICVDGRTRIKVENDFSLTNGILIWDEDRYGLNDFCVDNVESSRVAILCITAEEEVNRLILCIGMIISMPFLLATFLVYAILPESNLHRKALMNYVLTLLIAYILLVVVQLHPGSFDKVPCSLLGYTIIFFFLVSFFWMNVMCLDMWFAFRGMRGFNGRRIEENKRFLMYFAYAFGVPLLHTLVVFGINMGGDPDASYYPAVGLVKCFLNDGLPNLLYFFGPMAILITVNITLFILTAVKIQKVKKETSMLKHSDSKRHSYEDDKQKFNLYVKLLFAMGINWSMEVISWAIQWKTNNNVPLYVWYLTDFCNAVYGVFIFLIFVFKKKVWKSLKRRYYVFRGKPYFAHSTSVTQTTRASNYSNTESSMADHRLSEFKNGRGEERILRPH